MQPWKGSVAVWLSVYLILRQVVRGRKDDGELAGKPKKIRSAAVDGEKTRRRRRRDKVEALTDVK